MNEAETRAEHIDPALRTAGWGVVEGSRVRREFITPGRLQCAGQRGKPEIADYVLFYKNRKLAVIEAKRWGLPHTEGLPQAKQYAHKLGVRFTYSTNGQRIYLKKAVVRRLHGLTQIKHRVIITARLTQWMNRLSGILLFNQSNLRNLRIELLFPGSTAWISSGLF